jgi:hypothetical protein
VFAASQQLKVKKKAPKNATPAAAVPERWPVQPVNLSSKLENQPVNLTLPANPGWLPVSQNHPLNGQVKAAEDKPVKQTDSSSDQVCHCFCGLG